MPTRLGGEFRVNTTNTSGGQRFSSVTGLSDGRFVVSFEDTIAAGGSDVFFRLFNADGTPVGSDVRATATTTSVQANSSVTRLGTGFVMTWEDYSRTGADTMGPAIRAQVFDAAGSPVGAEFLVNTTTAGNQRLPDVVALAGGRFVIGWQNPTTDSDIVGQVYEANGARVGGEFSINTITTGAQEDVSLAALADGGFVATWTDNSNSPDDTSNFAVNYAVRGQRFDASGAKVGSDFLVNTTTLGYQWVASVQASPDGGFVVVFRNDDDADNTSYNILFQAYDAQGQRRGGETAVTPWSSSFVNAPDLVFLPNGGYVVMWEATYQTGPDIGTSSVWIEEFTAQGVSIGGPTIVNTATTGRQIGADIALLANGDVIVTWDDFSNTNGTNVIIAAQRFSTAASVSGASGGDDTLIGAAGADTIDGLGGNDDISGLGGDDVLGGGDGDDLLNGGEGDDTLQGGLGDDVLNGGAGSDTADYSQAGAGVSLRLQTQMTLDDGDGGADILSSIENATGSAFNDVLFGDAGNNVLSGGLGADILLGLGGNDILIGGSGAANTLQGGVGDDTYVVETTDTLTEFSGEGTDTVQTVRATYVLKTHFENLTYTGVAAFRGTGNAADNVITGNVGADTLTGLDGADTLSGRGGIDILDGGNGLDTADYSAAAAGVSVRLSVQATLNDGDGARDTLAGIENVTGSAFADTLFGGATANVISGGLGADILLGLGGDDTLIGGSGASNTLQGGLGDDTYVVSANDTITEFSGEGTDTVQTDRAFFTLGANLENLSFIGAGSFNGIGNAGANVITGGAGDDNLAGGQGNDVLNGGGGEDYVVLAGVLGDYIVNDLGGGSYRIMDTVGGRDGTDITTDVERVRFVTGPTVALASLAVPAPAPLEPADKDSFGPQVLPSLAEDDFVMGKGAGEPEVLPGAGDAFTALDGVLAFRETMAERLMLTLGEDGVPARQADDVHGHWDDSGWTHQ